MQVNKKTLIFYYLNIFSVQTIQTPKLLIKYSKYLVTFQIKVKARQYKFCLLNWQLKVYTTVQNDGVNVDLLRFFLEL